MTKTKNPPYATRHDNLHPANMTAANFTLDEETMSFGCLGNIILAVLAAVLALIILAFLCIMFLLPQCTPTPGP